MKPQQTKSQRFVDYVLKCCTSDKGKTAALKRADNPATEYQAWEILASFGIDLTKPWERLPFAIISAGIARAGLEKNGQLGLGRALSKCYEDGPESPAASARLRRILSASDTLELCTVLRPVLQLVHSRNLTLDYVRLLDDLLWFNSNAERTKARWAQDFFAKRVSNEEAL